MSSAVTARACANIALVKYWGKRDSALNLPATGSLSLSLAALTSTATVRFDPALERDEMTLDGAPASTKVLARTSRWLDLVRQRAGITAAAQITSANDFPTASGLASSASGFAALAVAASRAAGLALDHRELSILARRGSGSAARSIFGGLARMHAGERADGEDAFATPIEAPELVDRMRMVVAVIGGGVAKSVPSGDAMEHCRKTSPLYPGWVATVPIDLAAMERAIAAGDLTAMGAIAEGNALAMHATAMASRPAIVYWQPATVAALGLLADLRGQGLTAWGTIDAGPHLKVLSDAADADAVATALRGVAGVTTVIVSRSGRRAEVIG